VIDVLVGRHPEHLANPAVLSHAVFADGSLSAGGGHG
jgi:hypothetical protein